MGFASDTTPEKAVTSTATMRCGKKLSIRLSSHQREAVEQLARKASVELRETVHSYSVIQSARFIAYGIEPQDETAKRLAVILTQSGGTQ